MNLSELFDDCLFKIFEYIPIIDLIKMKIVNKKFYHLINQFKFKELIIRGRNNDDFDPDKNVWFYRDEKVNIENTIRLNILEEDDNQPIESILFKNYFKHLKYLKLYFSNYRFDLNLLNQLSTGLEHLEIGLKIYSHKYNYDINMCRLINLNLPNLKILSIEDHDLLIRINSKLEVLRCHYLEDYIELSNPECLKELCIRSYKVKDLSKFCNLEILWCADKRLIDFIDKLPNLKHYHVLYYDYIYPYEFDELTLLFKKRSNLKIYVGYCLVSKENSYEDYKFSYYSDKLEFFRDNYNHLDNKIHSITSIEYDRLIKIFNQIPDNFYEKFFNIQEIIVYGPVDENEFELFLRKSLNLIVLKIFNSKFSQNFYDNLPKSIPNLQMFELNELDTIDFNFLTKFNIIELIKLNQNLSYNLIKYILSNLKFIDELNLQINKLETSILLTKLCNKEKKFTLIYNHCLPRNNLSINQVLDLLIKFSA